MPHQPSVSATTINTAISSIVTYIRQIIASISRLKPRHQIRIITLAFILWALVIITGRIQSCTVTVQTSQNRGRPPAAPSPPLF